MTPFLYEDLEVLHNLAMILASPLDLREQLEQVLKTLSEQTGMDRGMISILDLESGEAILTWPTAWTSRASISSTSRARASPARSHRPASPW